MAVLTQVKVDSTTHDIAIPYAVCSTSGEMAAKTVDYADFSLETGSQIKVSFTYANTAANPTLNVNSTGAKSIVAYGTTGMTTGWKAGAVLDLTYNGTSWVITSFGGLADAEFSNIDLSGTAQQVPVVTSSGYVSALQYAHSFTVPSGTTLTGYINLGTTTYVSNSGVIEDLSNTGTIGDSTTSSSSSTGLNGLRGVGTVYISALGGSTATRTTSTNRLGTMVLKAGSSTSYAGAYIDKMNVNSYAAIGDMTVSTGASVSISSNAGTVKYLDWTLSESGSTLTFTY